MRLGIAEILNKASKLSKNQEKIEFLRKNYHPALGTIVKYTLDPNVKFILPEGAPPFKRNDLTGQETRLYAEVRKLYLFLEGCTKNLNKVRREALFIELLENVDPNDADLLIAMKDKKWPYKTLSAKLMKEAYPGLIEEEKELNEQVS
jgi:hypothetical protein